MFRPLLSMSDFISQISNRTYELLCRFQVLSDTEVIVSWQGHGLWWVLFEILSKFIYKKSKRQKLQSQKPEEQ